MCMRQPDCNQQVHVALAQQRIDFGMAAAFHGNAVAQTFEYSLYDLGGDFIEGEIHMSQGDGTRLLEHVGAGKNNSGQQAGKAACYSMHSQARIMEFGGTESGLPCCSDFTCSQFTARISEAHLTN